MTHLLDTSALLAHYLAETGAERVQALFEDAAVEAGASILSLFGVWNCACINSARMPPLGPRN